MPGPEKSSSMRLEEHFETDRQIRLALVGELDLGVVEDLSDRLRELQKGDYDVCLDLSRLRFLDSTGLREIILAVSDARRDGWSLTVDPHLTEEVGRLIDLVGARAFFWPPSDGA
jgi:anti-anti-sigma factor